MDWDPCVGDSNCVSARPQKVIERAACCYLGQTKQPPPYSPKVWMAAARDACRYNTDLEHGWGSGKHAT